MFDATSRYSDLEDDTYQAPDGHTVRFKRRRFLPHGAAMPLLQEVEVATGDRLDLIAARTLGDPQQFWQICDANNCMNPFDLTGDDAVAIRLRLRIPAAPYEESR
jgi:hypothetical protein